MLRNSKIKIKRVRPTPPNPTHVRHVQPNVYSVNMLVIMQKQLEHPINPQGPLSQYRNELGALLIPVWNLLP